MDTLDYSPKDLIPITDFFLSIQNNESSPELDVCCWEIIQSPDGSMILSCISVTSLPVLDEKTITNRHATIVNTRYCGSYTLLCIVDSCDEEIAFISEVVTTKKAPPSKKSVAPVKEIGRSVYLRLARVEEASLFFLGYIRITVPRGEDIFKAHINENYSVYVITTANKLLAFQLNNSEDQSNMQILDISHALLEIEVVDKLHTNVDIICRYTSPGTSLFMEFIAIIYDHSTICVIGVYRQNGHLKTQNLFSFTSAYKITVFAYDPLQSYLILGFNDGCVNIINLLTLISLGSICKHETAVTSIVVKQNIILSGAKDGTLCLSKTLPSRQVSLQSFAHPFLDRVAGVTTFGDYFIAISASFQLVILNSDFNIMSSSYVEWSTGSLSLANVQVDVTKLKRRGNYGAIEEAGDNNVKVFEMRNNILCVGDTSTMRFYTLNMFLDSITATSEAIPSKMDQELIFSYELNEAALVIERSVAQHRHSTTGHSRRILTNLVRDTLS